MPAAIAYLSDPQSPEYKALEDAYSAEYVARGKAMAAAWAYYRGQMHKPLRIESDGVDDNVLYPLTTQVANTTRSLLLGEGPQFDADPESEDESELDAVLDEVWRANKGKRLLADIALYGILAGHCWAQVVPVEGKPPRILALNPAYCSAFWDVFDTGRVLWYRLQAAGAGSVKRQDYVLEGDTWVQYVYQRREQDTRWELTAAPSRLEFLPIIEWQNVAVPVDYYGLDDVALVMPLNDSVNLNYSDLARTLKHHGSPRTIGIGMDAADVVASSVGGFYTVNKPTSEANIYNLELAGDGLQPGLETGARFETAAWNAARLPDPKTLQATTGDWTNFKAKLTMADTLNKINEQRELYAEGLERLNKAILQAMGQTPPERIATTWPDVLPEDAQYVTTLMSELQAGVLSKQTYREIRGYDHEKEEDRIADEQQGENDFGTAMLSAFESGRNVVTRERPNANGIGNRGGRAVPQGAAE